MKYQISLFLFPIFMILLVFCSSSRETEVGSNGLFCINDAKLNECLKYRRVYFFSMSVMHRLKIDLDTVSKGGSCGFPSIVDSLGKIESRIFTSEKELDLGSIQRINRTLTDLKACDYYESSPINNSCFDAMIFYNIHDEPCAWIEFDLFSPRACMTFLKGERIIYEFNFCLAKRDSLLEILRLTGGSTSDSLNYFIFKKNENVNDARGIKFIPPTH